MRFKIGDHVVYYNDEHCTSVKNGEQGAILQITEGDLAWVRWDNYNPRRHTCDGLCKQGHGWNVRLSKIFHAEVHDLGVLSVDSDITIEQLLI